jgi:phosphoribosylglycinamide formyltransferase
MDPRIRLTVLISGNGTNLQAVIDKAAADNSKDQQQEQEQRLPVNVIRVLSNRKDAYGLKRAETAGIPTLYHNLVKYKKQHPPTPEGVAAAREDYDAELARLILADAPELVACLGFMHVLSPKFLEPLEAAGVKIVNLHPALPGQFNGVVSLTVRTHIGFLFLFNHFLFHCSYFGHE